MSETESLVPLKVTGRGHVTVALVEAMDVKDVDQVISDLGTALRDAEEFSCHVLGALLSRVLKEKIHKQHGMSFGPYVDSRLGFKERKAKYLISIWETFHVKLNLEREMYEGLGWAKLKELVPIANVPNVKIDNVTYWLDWAKDKTAAQIKTAVKESLNPNDEEDKKDKKHTLTIKMFEGEFKVVQQAFDVAAEMLPRADGEEPRPAQVLEMICADFLSGADESARLAAEDGVDTDTGEVFDDPLDNQENYA